MKILGIDPGYGRIGFAIIEDDAHKNLICLEHGVFESNSKLDIEYRLVEIHEFIDALVKKYSIQYGGIEEIFFRKNLTTGINIIQARGVIAMTMAANRVEIFSLTPTALKKFVTGHGQANKEQMMNMVKKILKLENAPRLDDAADALAVALAVRIKLKLSKVNKGLLSK